MKGFYNRLLEIDLTHSTCSISDIQTDVLKQTLGGKGLATKLLLEHNPAGVDPLSPENRLIFATGPVCNSSVWGGSRYGVFTKSPLTGLYCESYAGGKTPEAIDGCGFDAIIIHGKAKEPVLLEITGEGAVFHSAEDLWGMDAFLAEDAITAKFPQAGKSAGAVTIGPAGEKGVRFAVISNNYWRQAGRGGAGAVMGSKHVKGIFFHGEKRREFANPQAVKDTVLELAKVSRTDPGVKAYKAQGTTMMVALMNTVGAFPARYWSQGTCDHWENLSGERYHKENEVSPKACPKCFMACGRMSKIAGGRHKGLRLEGPEYETIFAFGGLCMIEDMSEVAYLNDLCDRLGVDTITAGNLVALVMEATAQGKITEGGLAYGDADGAAALIKDMAAATGLGSVLAKGIVHAAKALDMEDEAVHVKGMEPPGYDPRVLKGMGLAYAVSDRGACHLRATFYKPELAGWIDRDQIEGKAAMFIEFEDRLALFDCLILCRFFRDLYDWDRLEQIITAITGVTLAKDDLQARGSHATELARRFNVREGMQPKADTLPDAFYKPLPTGQVLTREDFHTMRKDYYAIKGWEE